MAIRHFSKKLLSSVLMEIKGSQRKDLLNLWGGQGKHGIGDGVYTKS